MERIRFKQTSENNQKSLGDTSKIVRMNMADRRHSLDTTDKSILRSCLDTLQSSISVRSVTGMSERLETTARQLGLKFMVHSSSSSTHNFYISTETFYVEICIDKSGAVLETRIHHQNHQGSISSTPTIVPAPEISECLSQGDFTMFVDHLKGLISVYDLADCANIDKTRAWQALYNLEHDLSLLASGQSWVTDTNQMIHKTSLGMVHNRSGGIPMKLRYFLPPYELLDMKSKTILPMNHETITSKNLGFCATITLKSSKDPYLLPMSSLTSSTGQDLPITTQNAIPLPAHFALVLDKPLPMSYALLKQIVNVTKIDWLDSNNNTPLMALIVKQSSDGALDPSNNRGLFVTLPDQQHCYFMTETPDLIGQPVEYIPFRHPNQVSGIIDILRRQALFNTLVSSCVRTNSLEDVDTSTMFEVTCLDPTCQNLSVSFEHPSEETMATAELSLSDLVAPRCLVYTGCMAVCPEETANRVLQHSLSIPITMRAVINKGKGKIKQLPPDDSDIHVNSMNGLGHGLESMDTKSVGNLSGTRYKLEGGRGVVPGGGTGTPGTPACVKQESMEVDSDSRDKDTDSLNRVGPQEAGMECYTGALTQHQHLSTPDQQFRHPSLASVSRQSENRRRTETKSDSDSSSSSFSLTRGPLADSQNKPKKDSGSSGTLKPNVSITPIAVNNQYEDSISRMVPTTGIEIIPLGQGKMSPGGSPAMFKAKSRDLKRSFSEDDKRKLQKKEKKKRDDKIRQSLNQDSGKSTKSDKYDKYESSSSKSSSWTAELESRSNLAGVIERLSQKSKDNLSIEIKPASSVSNEKVSKPPNMEITLNQVKKDDYSPKPKLKLTIKPPTKHFEKPDSDTASLFSKTTSASPKLESSTFQIPKFNKSDSPTLKKERQNSGYPLKSPSTSPKHPFSKSPHLKINERFITDPSSLSSKRPEDRKRSGDKDSDSSSSASSNSRMSSHTSQSSQLNSSGPSMGELSPLSDSLLDEGLLMKWMALEKIFVTRVKAKISFKIINF